MIVMPAHTSQLCKEPRGEGAEMMAWDQMEPQIKSVIEIKNKFVGEEVRKLWG